MVCGSIKRVQLEHCTRSKNKLLASDYKTVINSKPKDHVNTKNSMKEKNILHESLTKAKKRIDKNELRMKEKNFVETD